MKQTVYIVEKYSNRVFMLTSVVLSKVELSFLQKGMKRSRLGVFTREISLRHAGLLRV